MCLLYLRNISWFTNSTRIIKKMQTFLQKRHIDGQQVHEKISTLLITLMQIKTAAIYHLTSIGITIIKKTTHNNYWQGCGEKETLCISLVGI